MKLTINTSFSASTSRQALFILVDSENLKQVQETYKINDLNALIDNIQYKASLNETLPLIGKLTQVAQCTLIGLDKASDVKVAKLAKIAQTIIKASQKNSNKSVLIFLRSLQSCTIYLH